jgi:gliding motility-associated-like protein
MFVANDLVYIPNAFTPNGDGTNEELTISHNECLQLDHFWVFDKWGTVIFETTNPSTEFWDGTYNGSPAQQDVYTYRLTGTDIDRTGFVVVLN